MRVDGIVYCVVLDWVFVWIGRVVLVIGFRSDRCWCGCGVVFDIGLVFWLWVLVGVRYCVVLVYWVMLCWCFVLVVGLLCVWCCWVVLCDCDVIGDVLYCDSVLVLECLVCWWMLVSWLFLVRLLWVWCVMMRLCLCWCWVWLLVGFRRNLFGVWDCLVGCWWVICLLCIVLLCNVGVVYLFMVNVVVWLGIIVCFRDMDDLV